MPEALPTAHSRTAETVLKRLYQGLKLNRVADALENALTGFGTSRSKVSAGEYVDDQILQPQELEGLFAFNDLAHTIVAKPVEDALRGGFCLERKDNAEADHEMAEKIKDRLEELGVAAVMFRGGTFGRLLGGAGAILGVSGAGDLSTPFTDTNFKRIESLIQWDRQDMLPLSWEPSGEVKTYLWTRPVQGAVGWTPVEVHHSRLLTFPGATTTQRKRNQNQRWDLSVLQRVWQALRSFDSMFASTDSMFADASQAVFHLQGLISSIAESNGTAGVNDVATRLALMDMLRSSAKAIVLDAGDETGVGKEDFKVVDRSSLGQLEGVIGQYYVRLAAAARMPLTVLLGMSPAGMNATGESDLLLYFNSVDVYRISVLEPRLLRLVRLVAREMGDTHPETWCVKWPELQRPKPLDVATAEKMKIDGAVALVTGQVALPEEVALSLRRIAPTLGLTINTDARRAMLVEALKELSAREMPGPGEAPEPPAGVSPSTKSSERKTPSKAAGRQV